MFTQLIGKAPALAEPKTTRRIFLLGAAAAAGGLAVGFRSAPAAADATASVESINPLEAYIRIGSDDSVTVVSSQFDMGQGSYHGIATLVVEELGARWDQIDVVGGWGNVKKYGNKAYGGAMQGTGGSSSMFTAWDLYRKAGAAAQHMLASAAAVDWSVPVTELTVASGKVSHPSGRSATFGALAAKAAAMPVPTEVSLKGRDGWTQIGNEKLRRFDSKTKTDGTHEFTIDLKLPGLLTAVMIHPPKFGATLKGFNASAAKGMPGVVDVLQTPRGIAVVGKTMWHAINGRKAVTVEWDETAAETRGTSELLAEYRGLAASRPRSVAVKEGDSAAAIASAAKVIEATYEFPFLAHAALEPLNAVARINADGTLEVWGGHQFPDVYQAAAAKTAGISPDKVKMHVMKTGGGFGRRAVMDADVIVEAAAVAKALGPNRPVRVQWLRANDVRGGRYRPAYVHAMKAGLDAAGNIVGWEHHIVGQSILKGTAWEGAAKNGVDPTSVEGASNHPYAIPNRTVGLTTTDVGVPVLWWRSVGSTHTAFAVETFLDELAEASGKDPLEFRLALLRNSPRHAGVLRIAAEKAGWGTPPAKGRVRGLSMAESFGTFVAQVVEVRMDGATVKVEKVVCAVDCGIAINPDNVRAQVEGGIGFGLSAILGEEITLTKGVVDQENYDSYTPLRIEAMPKVEVHIVSSNESPTGIGEPGVPPIGPAVANAIYALTKKRIRTLPMKKSVAV